MYLQVGSVYHILISDPVWAHPHALRSFDTEMGSPLFWVRMSLRY
eukprot:SAG31_NODE_35765_length_320_cov_0.696833_1_plen_44_part_10